MSSTVQVPGWLSALLSRTHSMLLHNPQGSLTYFLDAYTSQPQGNDENEQIGRFKGLESFIRQITPPDEDMLTNPDYFTLWTEYYSLCTTKEYVLYYLEDSCIGTNTPRLYCLFADLHMKKKEMILADEWIRQGLKKFPQDESLRDRGDELYEMAKNELLGMVGSLDRLYSRNNWNDDQGIPKAVFELLFLDPISRRRSQVFHRPLPIHLEPGNTFKIPSSSQGSNKGPPAFWKSKKDEDAVDPTRRLSDTCFIHFDKGNFTAYIDRMNRESYYSRETLFAREWEYRRAQNGQPPSWKEEELGDCPFYMVVEERNKRLGIGIVFGLSATAHGIMSMVGQSASKIVKSVFGGTGHGQSSETSSNLTTPSKSRRIIGKVAYSSMKKANDAPSTVREYSAIKEDIKENDNTNVNFELIRQSSVNKARIQPTLRREESHPNLQRSQSISKSNSKIVQPRMRFG